APRLGIRVRSVDGSRYASSWFHVMRFERQAAAGGSVRPSNASAKVGPRLCRGGHSPARSRGLLQHPWPACELAPSRAHSLARKTVPSATLPYLSKSSIGPRRPGSGRAWAKRMSSPIALCMIVRNEEANLEACLAPIANLFDDIVVVDTGSTDTTREIARR